MTRPVLLLTCLALLAGCGGGGGAGEEPRPVIPLTTQKVIGLSPTYRALFDCTARVTLDGTPLNVTGTYLLETRTGDVTHPQTGLTGTPVRNDISLGALGQTVDLTVDEFVYVDSAGRWWSLGGEVVGGQRSWWSDSPPASYPAPIGDVQGRILNLDESIFVGQTIVVPEIAALDDADLGTTLFTRTSTRTVVGTEVVDTALGRYECFRVEVTETVDYGSGPVTVEYVRWERPEMGLLALHAEGIDVADGGHTVHVTSMDAVLAYYQQ